jgi:3-oxoacyl-[acyl-carrier-protein] synthase-1
VLDGARVRCAWLHATDGGALGAVGAAGERTLVAELEAVLRECAPGIALEREPAPGTHADVRAPAWQQALDALAAGAYDALLIGGVHSDYHPAVIAALDTSGRLAPPGADALVPGEAAAFAVVCGAERLRAAGSAPRGWVLGYAALRGESVSSQARGGSADDVADARAGSARAQTVAGALVAACSSALAPGAVPVGWVVSDTTAERASVRSWMEAARACAGLWRDPCELTTPAEQLGRLGSAALPLALGLITEGFVRGYARERSAVGLVSDTPDVAVVLVAAAGWGS